MKWDGGGLSAQDALVLPLGGNEVQIAGPCSQEGIQNISEARTLLEQRVVSEDDAALALQLLESAAAAPDRCPAPHVCLAEVYLSGSAPQHGMDHERALESLVAFASVARSSDQAAIAQTAQISAAMDDSVLAPRAAQLLRLAGAWPELRGVALRAHIVHIRHPGKSHGTPTEEGCGPIDVLTALCSDLTAAQELAVSLHQNLRQSEEQQVLLVNALGTEERRRESLEDACGVFRAELQQREAVINDLRGDLEMRLQDQQDLQDAAMVVEAMRQQCDRFQAELAQWGALCAELRVDNSALRAEVARADSTKDSGRQRLRQQLQREASLIRGEVQQQRDACGFSATLRHGGFDDQFESAADFPGCHLPWEREPTGSTSYGVQHLAFRVEQEGSRGASECSCGPDLPPDWKHFATHKAGFGDVEQVGPPRRTAPQAMTPASHTWEETFIDNPALAKTVS